MTSFYTDKDYGQENAFMKLYVQTSADKKIPDSSILSMSIFRTNPDSQQNQDRNFVRKYRTEFGQQAYTAQDFPENPDKNETRTRLGKGYPPTSEYNVGIYFRNQFK